MAKKAKKRKYSKGAAKKVKRAMKTRKAGTLKSGRPGQEGEEPQTGDRDWAFRGAQEGRQGPEEKEILASGMWSVRRRATHHPLVKFVKAWIL